MAARLRPPGSGSKLARPGQGGGLPKPGGRGLTRPSPQPGGETGSPAGPQRRTQPANQARPPATKPAQPASETTDIQVGDNVLVGGVKPGVVAFVGPTQFAPGVWAGVVLDTNEGKNDGSVKGVSYFQCEPNHGLFSRPEKLTKAPKTEKPAQTRTPRPSFEVGDRVLVDGSKTGTIGFLGETQFAQGMWAGVVLDEPEGKNAGVVKGVQYFECEPNHGLFTRTQKLSLIDEPTPTPVAPSPQANRINPTPPGPRQPGPSPSDLRALQEKLKIGDHVLVGGMKEGKLRFLGPTEFAKGIWAGVELPAPMGKNDGAVSGKRYFQCEPKYGIFAPLPKIEKLATAADSVSTRSAASLRSISPTPPPVGVSSPSSSLKSPRLRNKPPSESSTSSFGVQGHKLASLQGSTAAGLSRLLQQREETIANLKNELLAQKNKSQEDLTTLRRQVDDLQFQLLEQGVISGDQLEKKTESNEENVSTLTSKLEENQKLVVSLTSQLEQERDIIKGLDEQLKVQQQVASSSGEVDDLKEQLEITRNELAVKTKELETQSSNANTMHSEFELAKQTLSQQEDQLESISQELRSSKEQVQGLELQLMVSADQMKVVSDQKTSLQDQLDQLSTMSGDSSQQLTFLQDQLKEKESKFEELHSQNSNLSAQLTQVQSEYQSFEQEQSSKMAAITQELEKERDKSSELEKEITHTSVAASDIEEELSRTKTDLKASMELVEQHEELIQQRNQELENLDQEIRKLTTSQEQLNSEKARMVGEQEKLVGERDRAVMEAERLAAASESSSSEQNEMSRQRMELVAERDSLVSQKQDLQTENEKLIAERDEVLRQLAKIQSDRQEAIDNSTQLNTKFESTNRELTNALSENEGLKLELSKSRENWDQEKIALKEQVELAGASSADMREHIESASKERDSALHKAQEVAERLDRTERDRDQLQLSLESAQGEVEELNYQMEELNTRYLSLEEDSAAIQGKLDKTTALLTQKDNELADYRLEVQTLTEANQGDVDQAILEEEKLLLEERVKELTIQLERVREKQSPARAMVGQNTSGLDSDTLSSRLTVAQEKLLEREQDITDLQQQIEFLNSVIADLQRKLETAEALSGLHGPIDPGEEEYYEDEEEMGLPPPRLFCDICDLFDQHDTDDCPLQAGSDSPPPSQYHGARAPGGSDRPYCDTCEMFGHATEDCEYDATY